MTQSIIIEKIYKDKNINEAINNIVNYQYREDFKSFFIEQVYKIKKEKLIDLDQSGELFWYLIRIMTNQWDRRNSDFWSLYGTSYEYQYEEWMTTLPIEDDNDIDMFKVRREVEMLLEKQYKNWQVNNYHKTLFKMYYFDKKTYKQIEKETSIHFTTVAVSIRKTRNWLKQKIKGKL